MAEIDKNVRAASHSGVYHGPMSAGAETGSVLARFSTGSVPTDRRVEDWEAYHASTLVGLRTVHAVGARFRAQTSTLELPRMRIAKVTGSPHTVRRESAEIAAHPVSGALVYLPLQGTSTFAHRSGRFEIGPARGVVLSGDTSFSRALSTGVDEIVVRLPRESLRQLTGAVSWRRPTLLDIGDGSPHDTAGREFTHIADALATRGLRGGSRLDERMLDLLATLLTDAPGDVGTLDEAQAVIAEHHRDPGLTASRIARLVGLSERHLSRLFAEAGHSVPQTVLSVRLETARDLLADPAAQEMSMAEVAAASGFRSQAQFSRSYRQRFGSSPLRHRKALVRGLT